MSKQFEIFWVKPKSEKLREFRQAFVDSIECPTLYKVLFSNQKWFYYRRGIYDVSKQLGSSFFQFGLVPISASADTVKSEFQNFINKGCLSSDHVKAIRYEGKDSFILSSTILMEKRGRNFQLSPVIPINQDLYNLFKIEQGDYDEIEESHIGQYAEFFEVSDTPELIISSRRIEEMFKNGLLTFDEYLDRINSLKKQENLVLSLRQ